MDELWHVARTADLQQARETGIYRTSTLGASIDEVGFIHACYPHQLPAVAKAVFSDDLADSVVLIVDTEVLRSSGIEVRVEESGGEAYPHIYGALPMDAVVAVRPASFAGGELVVGAPV